MLIDSCAWNFLRQAARSCGRTSDRCVRALHPALSGNREGRHSETEVKRGVIEYIERTMRECNVAVASTFGFYVPGQKLQRYGGFGHGTFASEAENGLRSELLAHFVVSNAETGSGLLRDEADLALAVQPAYGIVLTNDRPTKDGPLQYAAWKGGKVLHLKHFEPSGLSLRAFISAFHDKD